SLFVPIHWSDETASSARVGELVSAWTDPHSGQPEAKATPAALTPADYRLHGFVRTSRPIALPPGTWWVRVATAEGTEYRLASSRGPWVWHDFAFRCLAAGGQLAEHVDGQGYRAAAFVDGAMAACIWLAPGGVRLQPDALAFSAADITHGHSQHV